jgi:hypothetical protein
VGDKKAWLDLVSNIMEIRTCNLVRGRTLDRHCSVVRSVDTSCNGTAVASGAYVKCIIVVVSFFKLQTQSSHSMLEEARRI